MIRSVQYRAVVQRNNAAKDKYYPTIIKGTTNDQYPFQTPSADVEIVTNTRLGTSGAFAGREDDIIRVQVCTKIHPTEKTVWVDLFEGTIQEINSNYGNKNTLDLHCVGYTDELEWSFINEPNKIFTGQTFDASDVFYYYFSKGYARRLWELPANVRTGVTFTDYNTTIYQSFMADVIREMEKYSGYTYRAYAQPIYDGDFNLSTVYFMWQPLATVATDKYRIIEGTSRYISSTFASSIEDLANYYIVIGSTSDGIVGTGSSPTSQTLYGKRTKIDTFNWIKSINQCTSIGYGVVEDINEPKLFGTATLIGTESAHPGDLVYCKSPSQFVNGASIDTYMNVYRVQHNLGSTFTTTLDLGRIQKTAYDYIGAISKEVKTCRKNNVKC